MAASDLNELMIGGFSFYQYKIKALIIANMYIVSVFSKNVI